MNEHRDRLVDQDEPEGFDREVRAAEAALLGTDWPGVLDSFGAWRALQTKTPTSVDSRARGAA
jgi:hypothetical protein